MELHPLCLHDMTIAVLYKDRNKLRLSIKGGEPPYLAQVDIRDDFVAETSQ